MQNFDVSEHWYKAVIAAGVALGVAAVAVQHNPLLIVALGMISAGVGEFINHPYREALQQDDFGRVIGKISGNPRNPCALGVCLDGLGAVLLLIGLAKLILA